MTAWSRKARVLARAFCLSLAFDSLAALGDDPPLPAVDIRVEGLSEPLEQNVRAMLTLAKETGASDPERIAFAHGEAQKEIRTALEPFGYYQPKISASLTRRDGRWRAVYRVDAGPPIRLTAVDVRVMGEAAELPEMRILIDNFPLRTGDVLDHTIYEKGKGGLRDLAAEWGFFDARFERHEIRVERQPYQASIDLLLRSGKRYRFGAVRFSESPLKPKLLNRYLKFKPGEPYRASALLSLQKTLFDSGYFSKADVVPHPRNAENLQVPLDVNLAMAPRNRYQGGVGYGTDTGPRVTVGYRNRFINRSGHSFNSLLRYSLVRTELEALYAIPLERPDKDQLGISAKLGTEDTVAGQAEVFRAGVRRTSTRWDLREILSLDVHRENFKLAGERQTTWLLMPSAAYTWLQADREPTPGMGARLDFTLSGAYKDLLSDLSFLKVRLNAKGVYALTDSDRFIVRGQVGWIATNDFDRLPLTQRFYAGGDQSVRGYRLNEISPTNSQGDRTGGRSLLLASLEYERMIYGDWGVAAFYDLGGVFNDPLGFNGPLRAGVGLGIRWRSPVGPVRADFGLPLSKSDDSFQFHLILGPDL